MNINKKTDENNNKNKLLLSLMKTDKLNVFQCPFCDKKYTTARATYRHIDNVHTNPKGNQCLLCLKYIKNFYYHKKHCHKTKIIYDNKQLEKLNNSNNLWKEKWDK